MKKGVYVRGAHNAQDIPEYPRFGAGTYLTVENVRDEEAFWKAVQEVWASTWSRDAYMERWERGANQLAVWPAVWVVVAEPALFSAAVETDHPVK